MNEKMNKGLLLMGGGIHLLVALMHLALGQAFTQTETLRCLSQDIRATVYTLNVHVAFTCLIFAYVSFFYRKELISTSLGRAVTASIGIFWILRAANQLIFYGVTAPDTPFWVVFCLIVSLFYMIPTLGKRLAVSPSGSLDARI